MRSRWGNPGEALQRDTGARKDHQEMKPSQAYATSLEIQTRYLRRRCGLDDRRARLVASLYFGEGR